MNIDQILTDLGGNVLSDQMTTTKRIAQAKRQVESELMGLLPEKQYNSVRRTHDNGVAGNRHFTDIPAESVRDMGFNDCRDQMEAAIKKYCGGGDE